MPVFSRECGAICCNSCARRNGSIAWTTILTCRSTVPTKDEVLVPETLLKKRKSQEQARAARREEAEKKKKVSSVLFDGKEDITFGDEKKTTFFTRLDQQVNVVAFVNHLSGLMSFMIWIHVL